MKVNVLFERAKDGYYSCFMEEELPDFGLAGYGDTAEAAKADFSEIIRGNKRDVSGRRQGGSSIGIFL